MTQISQQLLAKTFFLIFLLNKSFSNFKLLRTIFHHPQTYILFFFIGLLTVEPSQRLRMVDLLNNSWVQGCDVSSAPLMTPDVLTGSTPRSAEHAVNSAFSAFHQATRQGFRLQVCSLHQRDK